MQDIIEVIDNWLDASEEFVTATVVKTWGSGPRKVGSGMAIKSDGQIIGSVSGGCVEGDVVNKSQEVRQTGENKLLHYGVTDDEAWEVGLSCGGQLDILLERVDPTNTQTLKQLSQHVLNNKGCVQISELEGGSSPILFIPESSPNNAIDTTALKAYQKRKSGTYEIEGKEYFVNVFPRKSRVLIIGAAHISAELVELASMHNFETIVIDPRGLFSEKMSFKVRPDQSHQKWPAEVLENIELNSDVYAVLLTHDPKIDDQALHILLRSEVNYIGALGSRKTHEKRIHRLKTAGFELQEIERIHAPIGISIKANNPKEIALSIVAELIETRNKYL